MVESILERLKSPEIPRKTEATPLLPLSNVTPSPPKSTELTGYFYMAVSCIGVSGGTLLVHVAEDQYHFPALLSVFVRGISHTILTILYIIFCLPFPETFTSFPRRMWTWLAFHGLAGALCTFFLFFALQKLPVGDAVTIFFSGPVITMILSNIFLSEPITLVDIIAAMTSFVGCIFIARPEYGTLVVLSAHDRITGVVCALCAAIFSSVAFVTVRVMGTRVHFMMSLFSLAISTLFVSISLGGIPEPAVLIARKGGSLLSILSSLFALVGQGCLTKGLQLCRAGPGSLLRNLDVPIAYIFGMLFLSETPTLLRILGSTIVLFSAVLIGVGQIAQP